MWSHYHSKIAQFVVESIHTQDYSLWDPQIIILVFFIVSVSCMYVQSPAKEGIIQKQNKDHINFATILICKKCQFYFIILIYNNYLSPQLNFIT